VPALGAALRVLREAAATVPRGELAEEIRREEGDAVAALWRAAGLDLDVVAERETVVPGQSFELTVSLWNGGTEAVRVERLEPALPHDWVVVSPDPVAGELEPQTLLTRRFTVTVP